MYPARDSKPNMTRNATRVRGSVRPNSVELLEPRVMLSSGIVAFGAQRTFAAGSGTGSVTVADVNRDGAPDVLVTIGNSSQLGVLLGNGDGTFSPMDTFAVGQTPLGLAVGDLNGDGRDDVVVACNAGFSILLGNGDGSFAPQTTIRSHWSVLDAVVVADFNGDGKLDVAGLNADGVSVLLGNGDGTFRPQTSFGSVVGNETMASADFNADGKPDLAFENFDAQSVNVALGNGDGTFQPQQTFATGPDPIDLAIADVNRDGRPDLITANYYTTPANISVLMGNGDGTFQSQRTFQTTGIPTGVTVADVNHDGRPDLITSAFGQTGSVGVLLGRGDGNFDPPVSLLSSDPDSIAVADVNRDGSLDVIVANVVKADTVGVYLGDVPPKVLSIDRLTPAGPTTVDKSVTYNVTFNEPVTGVDASDFVAVTSQYLSITQPLAVTGSGATYQVKIDGITGFGTLGLNLVDDGSIKDAAGNPLQPGMPFLPAPVEPAVPFLAARTVPGDFNGDGRQDLLVFGPGALGVLPGNGDGTFASPRTMTVPFTPMSVATADVNGDGRADALVSSGNTIGVLLGNGDGTFKTAITTFSPRKAYGIATADFNGDGAPDLIAVGWGQEFVFLGNGNGTFQAPSITNAGWKPYVVTTGDVNGDGKPDAVVGDIYDGRLIVLTGNGDGTFQSPTTLDLPGFPNSVAIADMNGDGKPDIVSNNYLGSGAVSIFPGLGDGLLGPREDVETHYSIQTIRIADINSDGVPDIVTGIFGTRRMGVLLGQHDGGFLPFQTFATAIALESLAVADFNADGRPDVAEFGQQGGLELLASPPDGSFTGEQYTVMFPATSLMLPAGVNSIRLSRDVDGTDIDWQFSSATGQIPIDYPGGLTINGNANNDAIALDFNNGIPFPANLHLNGNFTVTGLPGQNPFADTTLDLARSTVYFAYSPGSSPLAAIQQALKTGYNGGAWNGSPTAASGAITSPAVALNPGAYAVGFSDSADGTGSNTTPNSVELKCTLNGDANLNGRVDIFDLNALLPHYNSTGAWTSGDFTYDGAVGVFDLNALLRNYNQTFPSASPASAAQISASAVLAPSTVGNASPPAPTGMLSWNSFTGDPDTNWNAVAGRKRHPRPGTTRRP